MNLEIAYWPTSVLCTIMRANPPIEVLEGFVRRIWNSYAIDKVIFVRRRLYLIRFQTMEDKLVVLQRGLYYFDGKSFIVKAWNVEMNINTENITSLPIWVHFPDLDIKYWSMDNLSKLESLRYPYQNRQVH